MVEILTLEKGWIIPEDYVNERLYKVDKSTMELVDFAYPDNLSKREDALIRFRDYKGKVLYSFEKSTVYFKNASDSMRSSSSKAEILIRNIAQLNPIVQFALDTSILSEGETQNFNTAAKTHRVPNQLFTCNKPTCAKFIELWKDVHNGYYASDYNQSRALQAVAIRAGFYTNILKKGGRFILELFEDKECALSIGEKYKKVQVPTPFASDKQFGYIGSVDGVITIF